MTTQQGFLSIQKATRMPPTWSILPNSLLGMYLMEPAPAQVSLVLSDQGLGFRAIPASTDANILGGHGNTP